MYLVAIKYRRGPVLIATTFITTGKIVIDIVIIVIIVIKALTHSYYYFGKVVEYCFGLRRPRQ